MMERVALLVEKRQR